MPEHAATGVPKASLSGRFRLGFSQDLETEYRASRRETERRWARMSLFMALSTVLGFSVIDHWVLLRPRMRHSDIVRFGLHLPVVLVMLVFSRERFFET